MEHRVGVGPAAVGGATGVEVVADDRRVAPVGLGQHRVVQPLHLGRGHSSQNGISGSTATLSSASCSWHSSISSLRRPTQIGSPIPRAGRRYPEWRPRNSCQAGMICAGLRPSVAMSTKWHPRRLAGGETVAQPLGMVWHQRHHDGFSVVQAVLDERRQTVDETCGISPQERFVAIALPGAAGTGAGAGVDGGWRRVVAHAAW